MRRSVFRSRVKRRNEEAGSRRRHVADHGIEHRIGVLGRDYDRRMPAGEDAEHLVAEALADDVDAREVERDVRELWEARDEPLGLGSGHQGGPECGELDGGARPGEAESFWVRVGAEHVLQPRRVAAHHGQLHAGTPPYGARAHGAVADLIVDDPGQRPALEPEAGHGLGGEEEALSAVPGRVAGELSLLELHDGVVRGSEAEILTNATEDADAVVGHRRHRRPALREGASSLILIHNHPSGDPTPSREDTRLTRQLAEAAQLMDLRIHDHVIIGNGTDAWVSLAARGLI